MLIEPIVVRKSKFVPKAVDECCLNDVQLLKTLSEEELQLLELHSVHKSFKRRSIIYREDSRHSGIYVVLKGIVKIYKIGSNGKQQILRFAQKGDIIAYRSLLTNEMACTSAKAFTEALLSYIPYNVLLKILQQNWSFTYEIMKIMCRELRDSNTFVTDMAQKSVRERTAEMLLVLRDEFGLDQYGVLQISLTREDLANMVGTVTESLIRIITEFRVEGLIANKGRKIVLQDVTKLQKVANL